MVVGCLRVGPWRRLRLRGVVRPFGCCWNLSTIQRIPSWTVSPRVVYVGVGLFSLAVVASLFVFDPRISNVYPTCPFLGLTGCYCPGCGTLRALNRLLYGDVTGALGFNLIAVLSVPFLAYTYFTGALRAFQLRAPRPIFLHSYWIWALLVGIIAFWTLRNLPGSFLTFLAP